MRQARHEFRATAGRRGARGRRRRGARVLRGDVVWATLDSAVAREQAGARPVVVVSADVFNQRSGTVIAMALTSREQHAGFPLTHELESVTLSRRAWVKIGQVRTLSTRRLGRRIGRVSPEEIDRIVSGLGEIIAG